MFTTLSRITLPRRIELPKNIFYSVLLFLLAIAGRTYIPYILLGIYNRLFNRFNSIFFFYAPNSQYRKHYPLGNMDFLLRWQPTIVGTFKQGGKYGLVIASPMLESDLLDSKNREKLNLLCNRIRRVGDIVGIDQISLAGIFPSVLMKTDQNWFTDPRPSAATAICNALEYLINKQENSQDLVIFGGEGFVGKAVCDELRNRNHKYVSVDKGSIHNMDSLIGKECILVNVSRQGALEEIEPMLWDGITILNEVFPEPRKRLVSKLKMRNIDIWHLSGVKGNVVPSLPGGYKDSVPCCAVHVVERDIQFVIKSL